MLSHKRTIRFDLLWSGISFIASFILLTYFGLGLGSIMLGSVVFLVGFVRGESTSKSVWAKALVLVAPYGIFLMGAMNGVFHLFFLAILCVVGSLFGVITRRAIGNKKWFMLFIIPFYLTGLYFFGAVLLPKYEDSTSWNAVTKPLPDFKLLSLEGDTLHSEDLKGKILIIDFWATWCGPCKDEFPVLERLYHKYKTDDRIRFLAIDSDKRDTQQKVKVFVEKAHYQLPFFIDLPEKLAKKYDIGGLPTILLVDRKGIVRFEHIGYSEVENFEIEFDKRMTELLK